MMLCETGDATYLERTCIRSAQWQYCKSSQSNSLAVRPVACWACCWPSLAVGGSC